MKVSVKTLTKENFLCWGHFISADDTTGLKELSIANYVGNLAVADVGEKVSLSILNPFKRDLALKFMEQHKKTHEICVAIHEDCIITVARDANGEPDPSSIEAFVLKEGDTVVYSPEVWHWVPYATGDGKCKQLIIYKDQTGANDFIKKELQQPVELELR